MTTRRFRVLLALAIALVTNSAAAQDKGAPAKSKPKPTAWAFAMTPVMAERLRSGDDAQIRAALDEIRLAGKAATAAAPIVAEILQRGLTLSLSEAALDTLGDVESESSAPILAMYAAHRNLTLRRAAVKALVHTRGLPAEKALRHALADADPMVRAVAATGLGTIGAHAAVGDLFSALDHKVVEAAAAIGQLCTPEQCDQLAGKLGRLPFDVVTNGLDQILFRPQAEVTDDAKIKLVGRVRELGTNEAHKFLTDVQTRWPKSGSPRVKQSIDQGVLATAGGSQ